MSVRTYDLSTGVSIDSDDMNKNHLICYVENITNCELQKNEINFKLDDFNSFMMMLEQYNVTKEEKQYVKIDDDDVGEKFDFPHDEIIDEDKYYNFCQYGKRLDCPYHKMMMVKYIIYSDLYRILNNYLKFKQSISIDAYGAEENIYLEEIALALKSISNDKYTRYTIVHELFNVLTITNISNTDLLDIQMIFAVDRRSNIPGLHPIKEELFTLLKTGKANAKVLKISKVKISDNKFIR